MAVIVQLPETLPIFPLPGALLLPRTRLPLNIYEPRYVALVEDCLKTDHRLLGLVQPVHQTGDSPLHLVGCAGRISSFNETDDGRYVILLSGVSRFRCIKEQANGRPYRAFQVTWDDFGEDVADEDQPYIFHREDFFDIVKRYFHYMQFSTDWDNLENAPPELIINTLSVLCPFDAVDKQALLEAADLAQRCEILTTLMEITFRGGATKEPRQ